MDSGANISILGKDSSKLIENWPITWHPAKVKIRTADGTSHRIKKVARILVAFAGKTRKVDFYLLPSISKQLILGTNFWHTFNIRPKMFTISSDIVDPESTPIRDKSYQIIDEGPIELPENVNSIFTTNGTDKRPYATVKIFDTKVKGLLDSGANMSVLGKGSRKALENQNIAWRSTKLRVRTADGTVHLVRKIAKIPVSLAGRVIEVDFCLLPAISKPLILGTNFWQAFDIRPTIFEIETEISETDSPNTQEKIFHSLDPQQQARLDKTKAKFKMSNDKELGHTDRIEHEIDTGDHSPIKQKQYHSSPYIQQKINVEIDRMSKLKIIEPASSPSWLNPIIAVKKSNGTVRLCLDARRLNSCTKKNSYPQQNLNRILEQIQGCKYISTIDLKDAYYQIKIKKECRHYTAFSVSSKGTFQYTRMANGLCNASSTLCELIQNIIGCDLEPFIFPYMDDFLVLTKDFDKHIEILDELANRLNSAGLTVSPAKSFFCMKQTTYVGYIISENGIEANPERMKPILNFPVPKNLKALRRFIGMAGWYRRFIPNFASEIAPITDLLKGNNLPFKWNESANGAFERLKSLLTNPPILTPPDFGQPFTIQCDASDTGIGAVLTQTIDENEKVIAFFSAKLNKAQSNYTTTEKECLAVILAVERFRPYVDGVFFTVITDHSSLLWLQTMKEPTSRLARWALRLQAYDFKLIHRKGKHNVVPDALSRMYMDNTETETNLECNMLTVDPISPSSFANSSDLMYQALLTQLQAEPTKELPNYKLENDILYHLCYEKFGKQWKIYVPADKTNEVLTNCHDNILAGHGGYWKTLKKIKEVYYWPKMPSDVYAYVTQCEACQAAKPSNENSKSPMGGFRNPKYPWRLIAIDFIGPITRSRNGKAWILTVVDVFSKYVKAFPMRHATAELLINILQNEIFFVYGVPQCIICDNGTQFHSSKFESFLSKFNVDKQHTSAYTPRQNPSECYNKIIGTALKIYVNKKQHDRWDEQFNEILCAINTNTNTTTKHSPYEILFAHRMITDGNHHAIIADVNDKSHEDHDIKISSLWNEVRESLKEAHERTLKQYNKNANPNLNFEPGEIVWKRNTELSNKAQKKTSKIMNRFVKCVILKKEGHNRYALCDFDTNASIGIFSSDLLRKARQKTPLADH